MPLNGKRNCMTPIGVYIDSQRNASNRNFSLSFKSTQSQTVATNSIYKCNTNAYEYILCKSDTKLEHFQLVPFGDGKNEKTLQDSQHESSYCDVFGKAMHFFPHFHLHTKLTIVHFTNIAHNHTKLQTHSKDERKKQFMHQSKNL